MLEESSTGKINKVPKSSTYKKQVVGAIEELKGIVYSFGTTHQGNQYVQTTTAIADYYGPVKLGTGKAKEAKEAKRKIPGIYVHWQPIQAKM